MATTGAVLVPSRGPPLVEFIYHLVPMQDGSKNQPSNMHFDLGKAWQWSFNKLWLRFHSLDTAKLIQTLTQASETCVFNPKFDTWLGFSIFSWELLLQ